MRYASSWLLLAGSLGAGVSAASEAPASIPSTAAELARLCSAEVRRLDAERAALRREMADLPQPASAPTSVRLGWHTKALPSPDEIVWVQVDLGERVPMDAVALVPTHGATPDTDGAGYGFPRRFRVEAADEADFARPVLIADHTKADVANPRELPLVFHPRGVTARFVRVTMTKGWPRGQDWVLALGEVMVVSGNRNIAAGRPITASNTLGSLPVWEAANLTDGQSVCGPPVAREASPSNGYLAAHEPSADVVKWVQVDLGRVVALEAVRLFPARPQDFADTPGNGFPPRFRVEVAEAEGFTDAVTIFETGEQDFVNPGDNPVTLPAGGARGRFVRVTATRLHNRGTTSSFALAELQAWSAGENVALGKPVTALDHFDNALYPRWQPEFLVDGFNSKNRLLDDDAWLAGLARRGELATRLAALDGERSVAVDATLAFFAKAGAGTLFGVLLIAGMLLWRSRGAKRQAVEQLRARIASDLHDEIGSNLGSIALLAEAARREAAAGHATEDFAAIEGIAARTHASLREIVWFIRPGAMTRGDLVTRMRESVPLLLGGMTFDFHSPPALREGECPLEFTRNVWLIFKESLHNAARHSGASRVSIRVAEPGGGFELEIRDDGCGFSESEVEPGNGLLNLRRRAADLHGTLRIASEPGRGTTVHLTIPRV